MVSLQVSMGHGGGKFAKPAAGKLLSSNAIDVYLHAVPDHVLPLADSLDVHYG